MNYTSRYNVNRGYMKLIVWQESIALVGLVTRILGEMPGLDFRLKSQILTAAQSISSNIAEGYCRRTIREYIQFVGISLGSSGELMTRLIGLKAMGLLGDKDLELFDSGHFSVENKLIHLKKSLEQKRRDGSWQEEY